MTSPHDYFRTAILTALGHAPGEIEPGRFQRFATRDRRGDSAGWCKLFADLRGGVFGCYRQGISETWSAADRTTMTRGERAALARQVLAATAEREAEQRRQWARNAERIAELWADCVSVRPGDPVALYLAHRLRIPSGDLRMPECLRLHPALPYWHEGERIGIFPAMVAQLTAPDGRMVALHRTYLGASGAKANVPTVKKLTAAAGPLAGACIALRRPVRGCIGIAEGIETALAAGLASALPIVAAYCAGNLAGWSWPAGVRRIVIFADADEAGRDAAWRLRARALKVRIGCEVLTPPDEGTDWCDAWAARGLASPELERAA